MIATPTDDGDMALADEGGETRPEEEGRRERKGDRIRHKDAYRIEMAPAASTEL